MSVPIVDGPTRDLLRRYQPILLATPGDRFLDGVAVYARIARAAAGRAWLQYWLAYPGDPDHAGIDWELALLLLPPDPTRPPVEVVLAKHRTAHRRPWNLVEREGDRPLVYVGLNKHASYFHAGWYFHGRHLERASGRQRLDVPLSLETPVAIQGRLAYRDPDRWVAATVA
jgi:hypothetical protein